MGGNWVMGPSLQMGFVAVILKHLGALSEFWALTIGYFLLGITVGHTFQLVMEINQLREGIE